MELSLFFDSKGPDVTGTSQNFTVNLSPPLILDGSFKVALQSCNIWYSWYNVAPGNNKFKYNNGDADKTITIPSGAYSIPDLNKYIKSVMTSDGDKGDNITITPNFNTIHTDVLLLEGYKIDFTVADSLRNIFGFNSRVVTSSGTSDFLANITNVDSILVNCSLVSRSYLNSSHSSAIYSFSPDKPPGSLLSKEPPSKVWLPVDDFHQVVESINFKITDQAGNLINLNNERSSIAIVIKEGTKKKNTL